MTGQPSQPANISRNCTPGYSPCLPLRRTTTVVVAQATDRSTPDSSASLVPIPTTWTETMTGKQLRIADNTSAIAAR